uniref:Eukaryotic translation initiation factor 1A X-linked a n=1 Tax=Sinocyclocheilus anshuiensis TaxID=1608454 RepID=A0A671N587_9TELE
KPKLLQSSKGGKNRRRGKNENESEKRELVFKEDGQVMMLKIQLCHNRNKLHLKIILKYNADEARSLKAYGELPEHGESQTDDDEIQFDDIGSDYKDIDDVSV